MISSKHKKILEEDNFWNKQCVHSGEYGGIELEHALFYGIKAIQEIWAFVPVSTRFNRNPSAEVKEKSAYCAMLQCKKACLWEETKEKYPKKDWDKEFNILHEKYKMVKFYTTK